MKSLIPLLALPTLISAASIDDLWITEEVPSTGQVEITNLGDGPVTTASALPFCHRFRYSDTVPSGTIFLEGESKVFSVNFSNAADSDLWLYRNSGFSTASNIITGLKWGASSWSRPNRDCDGGWKMGRSRFADTGRRYGHALDCS